MSVKTFITINDSRWDKYRIDFAHIVNVAMRAAMANDKTEDIIKKSNWTIAPWMPSVGVGAAFGKISREVSIILTDDPEIQKLNKKYRGKDTPTNVLSFETGDAELMGDIYISFDSVKRESIEHRAQSIDKNFIDHATHLIVHGVLHLLGYDHCDDKDARTMEALEVRILAQLGIKKPYDNSPLANCQSEEQRAKSKDKISWKNSMLYALCSMLCGAVASLGFAPFNLWWATILGIGGAYYLVTKRSDKSVLYSILFGAAYAVASFWWVLNSIYVVPELAAEFAIWTIPGIIGIAIGGALVFSLPFLALRRRWTPPRGRAILFAAAWTAVLWLREWFLTGFPWNPVANITMPFPALSNSMSLWGALGLTFIIVGFTASITEFFISRKAKGNFINAGIFASLSIIGIGYGYWNILGSIEFCKGSCNRPVIRIVQPARSAEQKATHSREQAIANANENIQKLAELAQAPGNPDIIVFPETVYPFVIRQEGDDLPLARELGRPIIIGATSWRDGSFYNSMIVANADGKIENIYSKSHLVPFGEYRPLGDIIPTPGQLSRGAGATQLAISNEQLAINFVPAICYEIIFSDSLVPRGTNPQAIVNLTNDTWFGRTPGTYQHLDMARRQAIEMGLPVVRANYSGISAFIGADGHVVSSIPIGFAGALDGTVGAAHMTPYRYIGRDWMMAIILAFSILCIAILRRKRK
ncbi:MAG: apolipoprotein N-acyltransferase [Alphaproteobacteria bacterium]|nr:apolipoprotein N-acyltransferase [Alphaproteobacteria bacterium]